MSELYPHLDRKNHRVPEINSALDTKQRPNPQHLGENHMKRLCNALLLEKATEVREI
jgi:hypothetical protein